MGVMTVAGLLRIALKTALEGVGVYHPIRSLRNRLLADRRRSQWQSAGMPLPAPDVIKQAVVRDYGARYGLRTLVETGTYMGDMIEAARKDFERVYSIELSAELAARARRNFARARNVRLLEGDSGILLSTLMPTFKEPVLFWLDAHYSAGITARGEADTPILDELATILASPLRHVVLVDDARCFGADPAYPTIDELRQFVRDRRSEHQVSVEHDIIRIVPASNS
jgi:hypothetical protein